MAKFPMVFATAWCGEYEQATPTVKAPRKRPAAGEVETRSEQG